MRSLTLASVLLLGCGGRSLPLAAADGSAGRDGQGAAVPAGSECWLDTPDECQKDDLVICVDGRRRAVSCKAVGFETCLEAAPGKSRCGSPL